MADKKKTKLTTYVDEQLAEDIKEIADTQDRPVSYVIGKILEEQVRKTKEEEEKSDDKWWVSRVSRIERSQHPGS